MTRSLDKVLNRALVTVFISSVLIVLVRKSSDNSLEQMMNRFLAEDFKPLPTHWLDFNYRIDNQQICQKYNRDPTIQAIILTTSHIGNKAARDKQRKLWPKDILDQIGIKRVFLLALDNANATNDGYNHKVTQHDIDLESEQHHDLIQFNFTESFRRLTYKNLMGLKWAVTHCNVARFIIKMDDDIVFSAVNLVHFLNGISKEDENKMLGMVKNMTMPVRDMQSKWFIRHEEFNNYYYPAYLTGWMYLVTPKTAQALVNASKTVPFFWVDDVYITGMLAESAGVKHKNMYNEIMKLGQ